MKKILIIIMLLAVCTASNAVLKERDLERTLKVLRSELAESYQESVAEAKKREEETQVIVSLLRETLRRCGQNSLMLYSQQQNYLFDLTYACHEATEQYQQFMSQQLPFKAYIEATDTDIAKYDSLITTLNS